MVYLDIILILIMLIITTITDIKYNKIENRIVLPVAVLGLLNTALLFDWNAVIYQLIAVFIAFVIGLFLFKLKKIGAGDVKLILAMICTIGWQDTLLTVCIGMILGVFYALYRMIFYKEKNIGIPLACMCLIGFVLVIAFQIYFLLRFG